MTQLNREIIERIQKDNEEALAKMNAILVKNMNTDVAVRIEKNTKMENL